MLVHELIKALNSVKPIPNVRNIVRSWLSSKCQLVIGSHNQGIVLSSIGGSLRSRLPLYMPGSTPRKLRCPEHVAEVVKREPLEALPEVSGELSWGWSQHAPEQGCGVQNATWWKGMWWVGSLSVALEHLRGLGGSEPGLFLSPKSHWWESSTDGSTETTLSPLLLGAFLLQEFQPNWWSAWLIGEGTHMSRPMAIP